MLNNEPLHLIFDPEDDVYDNNARVQIERAIRFGKIGSIEYIEYAKEQGTELRQLTRDAVHDINYDLMADSIDAYFFRNIYVERYV